MKRWQTETVNSRSQERDRFEHILANEQLTRQEQASCQSFLTQKQLIQQSRDERTEFEQQISMLNLHLEEYQQRYEPLPNWPLRNLRTQPD